MPYKVHPANREPTRIKIAGIETRIVTETAPLRVVDTKEDAKHAMREMIAHGVRPDDLCAVGYDLPVLEA